MLLKEKIYVMINGGSFSASSLISSNLKTPKVTFVGEETGGAFNGTV
jgi:C-terminal processing protease CtpA/Prc